MKMVQTFFLVLLSLLIASAGVKAQTFTDVAISMGIDHSWNGSFFAGGVSFADINMDGKDDITLSTQTTENMMIFRNRTSDFRDRVTPMGISELFRSKTVLWADYDNDGERDLLVVNANEVVRLYHNSGNGTHTDVTATCGMSTAIGEYTGGAWADYDNDGWLDLYVGAHDFSLGNILYHNNGDGTFTDVTATAGVANFGKMNLTVSWFDFNNDGLQDIYSANDLNIGNTLFKNNGDGTFSDVSVSSGANLAMACMGIAIGDYDNNGYLDLYLSNSPDGNRFLKNNGDETFTEVATTLGMTIGRICWGSTFFDFDNDGDLDLFVSVSDGPTGPGDPARTNVFYTNNGDGTFTENSGSGLMTDNDYSYGNAVGDFNSDGWQDLIVLNANGTKTKLYQNSGGTNNWIKILLTGTSSNFDGFGSVIEVYQGGSKFIRSTHSAVSFESQNSRTNTIGVGTATVIDSIRVLWPSGIVDVLRDVPVGQLIDVVEGTWASPIQHFRNVAMDLGIDHTYNVDFMGAGVSFVDFNKDGLDDITLGTEGGNNIEIFRNKTPRDFKNVVTRLGLSETSSSRTIIWVDYDNDGDKDLFIANADNVSHLYRRDTPSSFTDVTATSGLSTANVSTMSAAWADYDNDGWLDVYIGNRVNNLGNYLYHNNGDGTFTDVTTTAGVSNFDVLNLTVTWLDFNNDGYQDIYLANDFEQGNTLFKNNGDGTFADVSVSSGADLHFAAMGLAVGDYNNDGFVDIYVSNSPVGNGLLKNNGDGTFTDVAASLGLLINKICWGANFVDYDNDGDLDLFVSVSHGNGMSDPESQNVLFANNGDGTFSTPVYTWINLDKSQSYGNAIGDFNNDGFSDIAVVNGFGTKTTLWKNSGNSINHWIKLNLHGVSSNKDAIGSVIEVTVGGNTVKRFVHSQISFQSQNSLTQIIGVGSASIIDEIKVTWSSGTVSTLTNVAVDQTLTITEGALTQPQLSKEILLPQQFGLDQNFPNPFNPSTVIKYQLPEDAFVKIEIFSVTGEKIADLVNSEQNAGYYTVNFDANNIGRGLSSGIYLYRITVDERSTGIHYNDLKKMILMK